MKLAVILFLAVWLAVNCIEAVEFDHSHGISVHSSEGGGSNKDGIKHNDHKHTSKSGRNTFFDEEEANKGDSLIENHKVEDEEEGGKRTDHFDEGHHKSSKKSSGGSAHGLKYEDGSKHKKTNFKKGFREKYHKDEQKKHDSFYSDAHKSGEYKVFGKKHAKHSAETSSKKAGAKHKGGKASSSHGKTAKKSSGHKTEDNKGHQGEKSAKSHHDHGQKFSKKSSRSGGKQYHYSGIPSHHK